MSESKMLDEAAIAEIEEHARKAPNGAEYWKIPALIATVRQLLIERERGALCEECKNWEYNTDGSCRTFMVCGVCWNKQSERVQQQLQADVARFSKLADERHDQLWEARRQRDDLAAKCAPYLEQLK